MRSTRRRGPSVERADATGGLVPLLSVENLEVAFKTQEGFVPAVRGVSFDIYPGETLAIVGESGSGKSTTAHAIINLLPGSGQVTGGKVMFEGRDLTQLHRGEIEDVRGKLIGLVPQDPMNSLNPVHRIGFQVEETIKASGLATTKRDVRKRAVEVLKEAGLSDAEFRLRQFPHEFSGGASARAHRYRPVVATRSCSSPTSPRVRSM